MSDSDDTRFLLGRLVEGQEKVEQLLNHYHQTLTATVEDHGDRIQAIEKHNLDTEQKSSNRKSWLAGAAATFGALVGAGGAKGWSWIKSLFDG